MNRAISTKIADVLNHRGFILHDDVMTEVECGDDGFARLLHENEDLLRACGYAGGELSGWSSSFRYPMVYAYGAVDGGWYWPEQEKNDYLIDSYVFAVNDMLEESSLAVQHLLPMMLNIKFKCKCGHENIVLPPHLSTFAPITRLHQVTGKCTVCGRNGVNALGAIKAF